MGIRMSNNTLTGLVPRNYIRGDAMKKIISLLICILLVLSCFTATAGETSSFAVVKVPQANEGEVWELKARYKDTKQPITLSKFYNGYVFATVPKENEGREIEAFTPQAVEFSDYSPEFYQFNIIKKLSGTGVIIGNEKGEAKPFDEVTRAEAVAMVMRFLGLGEKNTGSEPFDDVEETDWFYNTVVTAYGAGIIVGDSATTFSPERAVTREEITVMTARALTYANLGCNKNSDLPATDWDKISPWAVSAYEMLGGNCASDVDYSNYEQPGRAINPQKNASRFDIAYTLYYTAEACQFYPSDEAVYYGFDKKMPVIDGSTSTYPFTRAVYSSLFNNGLGHPQMPAKHSKSHVSYQRLINGEVDMIFASVYPASDILEMAKEKGVELELIPIAYDAMIFFTNKDNPAKGLTSQQISEIYVNNAYSSWAQVGGPDALLYPYCRNNDSGSHAQMEKHFLKGSEIHPQIRLENTSDTMSNVLTDVQGSKTENPLGYGLGYSIYYYFNNMDMFYNTKGTLKLLEIDGVAPNDETIAKGTYPLSNNTYIVLRADTPKDAPARKMAEFMLTEKGQQCVEDAGFGRLKKTF